MSFRRATLARFAGKPFGTMRPCRIGSAKFPLKLLIMRTRISSRYVLQGFCISMGYHRRASCLATQAAPLDRGIRPTKMARSLHCGHVLNKSPDLCLARCYENRLCNTPIHRKAARLLFLPNVECGIGTIGQWMRLNLNSSINDIRCFILRGAPNCHQSE